jgi:hypothetical protein
MIDLIFRKLGMKFTDENKERTAVEGEEVPFRAARKKNPRVNCETEVACMY